MRIEELSRFKGWFKKYTDSFILSADNGESTPFTLKVAHTYNVCANILKLLLNRPDSKDAAFIAEAIALFHDVGRFPQYRQYKTFNDSVSVNHGELGNKVLREEGLLNGLPHVEREIILQSVKYHNAYGLPDLKDPDAVFFLKLIRDADKLDIWRVFTELYEKGDAVTIAGISPSLKDTAIYSPEVISDIFNMRQSSTAKAKTLNDYKLIQLSWVFDLNFGKSFSILREMAYIDRIISALPGTDEITTASVLLKRYIDERTVSAP